MPRDPFEKKFDPVMFKAFDALRKVAKSTWKAMGSTLKEIKASTSLLAAFGSEALIAKVYSKVIGNYTKYLSDTFWGEVIKGIDFGIMTTAVTDILGPIFSGVGEWIGDRIEEAPIGTSVGIALGNLIGSFMGQPVIGAAIGGAIGYSIEQSPVGAAIGGAIGLAIGGIFGGTVGAAVGVTVGTALGGWLDTIFKDAAKKYKAVEIEAAKRSEIIKSLVEYYGIDPTKLRGGATAENIYNAVMAAAKAAGAAGVGAYTLTYQDIDVGRGGQLYQYGTSYVPRTGPAIVHRGEEIIPANRRKRSTGGININIDLRNAVVDNIDRLSQKIVEQVMIQLG